VICKNKQEFQQSCAKKGVVVGVDYSASTVGVAVSDTLQMICNPLAVLVNTGHKKLLQDLLHLTQEHQPIAYVLGWPMHVDGRECDTCPSILRFAQKIWDATQCPILLMDERFTSKIAQTIMAPQRTSKKRKIEDKVAASLILESALCPL